MAYWVMQSSGNPVDPMLLREDLWAPIGKNGICPDTARAALDAEYERQPVPLGLFTGESAVCTSRVEDIPDFMMLGVIPVFSERARRLAMDGSCNETDFRACVFGTNRNETFYLYLPTRSWDVLDYSRSKFLVELPLDPAIPQFCESARFLPTEGRPPCCFRAPVPGHSQMSADLFVDERLRNPWEKGGMKGAIFKKVSDDAL